MDILKLLLIAHLIGDFFLQPVKLVEQKKNSIKGLIIHTLIYTLMIVLVLLLFGNIWEIIFWTLFILVSHSLIDYFRIKFTKKFNNNDFCEIVYKAMKSCANRADELSKLNWGIKNESKEKIQCLWLVL